MIVATGRIGLPGFDQNVLCHVAGAVEDPALDDDALASDVRTGDVAAEIVLEDFKAGLLRDETDMHVGTGRLRRRLRQIGRNEGGRCHVSSLKLVFEQSLAASTQHDIEAVGEALQRARCIEVELCRQTIRRRLVGDGCDDRDRGG